MQVEYVNELLKNEGASFSFSKNRGTYNINIQSVEELEAQEVGEQVNIRTLVNRMDTAYEANDYSNVLH